jgi:hypothetical protein
MNLGEYRRRVLLDVPLIWFIDDDHVRTLLDQYLFAVSGRSYIAALLIERRNQTRWCRLVRGLPLTGVFLCCRPNFVLKKTELLTRL